MNEQILKELQEIGFSGFVHFDKEKRDGKKRWTWAYPIKDEKEWFTVLLVEKNGEITIERLTNPLGQDFKASEVTQLLSYIRNTVKEQIDR